MVKRPSLKPMAMLNRKLWRDLWAMKTQAFAIALVMAAGIGTFVMSTGMMASLEDTRDAYYERSRFADVFLGLKRAPESLKQRIKDIPGVRQVETRVVVGAILDIEGMVEPATGLLVSIPERGEPLLNTLYMRMGRMVEPYRENEVVLAEAFAEAHGFMPGDKISAIISGRKRLLEVVGIALSPEHIYSMAPGGLFPDNKRYGVMWMGREALEAAHDMDGAFNDATIAVAPGTNIEEVIRKVDSLTRRYGGLGAFGREDQVSDRYLDNEMDQLRGMAIVIPTIFLAIAGFLLHTVLSRLISLEREQIGALKALGRTNWEVSRHYAKIGIVIAAVAYVLGIAMGLWFGHGMAKIYVEFFRFPALTFTLQPADYVLVGLLSLTIAVLGIQNPVRKAMSLQPAEAMRPAAPTSYRPTVLERLGLHARLLPVTRMIVRHIERRWQRSAISCLGIAAAVAVLIGASFMLDSLDFTLEVQFNRAEREDITVSLIEPQSRRAFHEIASLPGVLRAEPYRAVPARLRSRNFKERLSIQGVSADGDLHRMLDTGLNPIAVTPGGILLSDKLARLLHVGVGDQLTVEILEGHRPTREVRVSGIVEQYLGLTALMEIGALNSLMLEGSNISGAWLSTDSARLGDFHGRVKETPEIAGISMRQAAILSFLETMAENLVRMTIVNITFAAIIAFGVVYNAARISLSERARELASLRVLGFSRQEISYVLLGELALIVLAAIPIGCLLGYGLAWMTAQSLDTELFRVPLVVDKSTYGMAGVTVLIAAALSALVVRHRLDHLDLVAVLKTRE